MADDAGRLTPAEIAAERLDDWRYLAGKLSARFATGTFATGVTIVDAIAREADAADHHPDIDLRYTHLDVALTSHDVGGITSRDVRLARAISAIAADAGVPARPGEL